MGAYVGDEVGVDFDGVRVGDMVGWVDGNVDGNAEGVIDGIFVGVFVGEMVGFDVDGDVDIKLHSGNDADKYPSSGPHVHFGSSSQVRLVSTE